jgi:hypothetical protein
MTPAALMLVGNVQAKKLRGRLEQGNCSAGIANKAARGTRPDDRTLQVDAARFPRVEGGEFPVRLPDKAKTWEAVRD